ncbi:triadin isoform X5 [Poecilia formosa]|uniref:triadin isoform X5 n=1 Tax=Poecilia formosa TaxID=48698 RepID=UPI000443CC90|nr:PREDICTED: triadin isoform X5 [Poecilia formosa]
MLVSLATQPFSRISEDQKLSANTRQTQKSCLQLPSTMSGQTSGGEAGPPSRSNQRTFLDDVVLTFSSPMAWLLVVALVLTWSGVAIVLFDLLDYKTLAGLPPPPAIAKRGLRARAALRSLKPSPAGVHGDITPQESDDWLEMIWSFAASLVAPDEEEEGIHQLTETFTSFGSEEL